MSRSLACFSRLPASAPDCLGGAIALCLVVCLQPVAVAQTQLADVIEKAEKSVVRIEVKGDDGESLGSGFVVDDRGTIVTNCHVLAGATEAIAHFPSGKSCPVIGTLVIDPTRDIVVARIALTTAPAIPVSTVLPRKISDVFALGSPHGLSFTVTKGVVSAIRPAAEMAEDLGRDSIQGTWIQVDAALSPGNSGGPLINSKGEVVAMSTLASLGGQAQNLNFGISGGDIAKAIRYSRAAQLLPLRDGVANVEMEGGGGGGESGGPSAPEQALRDYLEMAREDFADLSRGLRVESARMSADLKDMRKGEPSIPAQLRARDRDAAIIRVDVPGKRERRWFFQSVSVKEAALEQQRERIRKYSKLRSQIRDSADRDSMLSLLMHYGPPLNPRRIDTVGFVSDLFVVHAFNEHDVLVAFEDKPYLVWMESTVGISPGEILSGPTLVAGTATVVGKSGVPTSFTVLKQVPEDRIRKVVDEYFKQQAPAADSAASGFRTWNDRTGRFSVEAILLSTDDTHAMLKKRDGSVIKVPIAALCDADKKYLRQ